MKTLLVAECRQGRPADATAELFGFARTLGAEVSVAYIGNPDDLPRFDGLVYFADVRDSGEYDPDVHKRLLLQAVEAGRPDAVVFMHSSWGWDLAPRVAAALKAAQVTEVTGVVGEGYIVDSCNGKMRRTVRPLTTTVVLTLQPGAFPALQPGGAPEIHLLRAEHGSNVEFIRYEPPPADGVDLTRAEVIVSAGRGVGSREHVELVKALAEALGGEVGASRPAVDAGWLEHSRQVGTTGQTVSPALYVACGISGAVQHLAGMKGAAFVLAVNTDRDAPIGEVADLFVVADLRQFLPALTAKLKR